MTEDMISYSIAVLVVIGTFVFLRRSHLLARHSNSRTGKRNDSDGDQTSESSSSILYWIRSLYRNICNIDKNCASNAASSSNSAPDLQTNKLALAALDHPGVSAYIGEGHYLQMAFCKSATESYKSVYPAKVTSTKLAAYAARHGHLELLQFMHANGCPLRWTICSVAAAHGNLDILQWWYYESKSYRRWRRTLWGNKMDLGGSSPWNEYTCACASRGGHLEVLQFLRLVAGSRWDCKTMENAAKGGHLKVLMWARAQGCQWSTATCAYAAMAGHLDVLKWLRDKEDPCPWDSTTLLWARAYSRSEVLTWATANGCPDAQESTHL